MQVDFLVIGSGLAGMLFALKAAARGSVLLITKRELGESNSRYAQGGIATVWDEEDSFAEHVQDTLVAGAGLCRHSAVDFVVENGPARVRELIDFGVAFTKDDDEEETYELGREGGHGRRRILHAKDQTGRAIVEALTARVHGHANIEVRAHHTVVDLITHNWLAKRSGGVPIHPDRVLGAYVLSPEGDIYPVSAQVTALCTGGAGKVYRYTTNPDVATGDGMAMAWRAGARMANMEFVQFHPTALFHPDAKGFLISEALRGEGGVLRLSDGEAFMARYDERKDLAPRDIVARAIDNELKRRGEDCVYLDMTAFSREFLVDHFPAITRRCMELGIDVAEQFIPVVPACHYFCGGVDVNLDGESSLESLFVVGESSCTGLHGANRLASNSLLEAAVFAHRAAQVAATRLGTPREEPLPAWDTGPAVPPDELVVVKHTWAEIRTFMWNYVGIVRTTRRLKRARNRINLVREEVHNYYWDYRLDRDLLELRNLADVAYMVVESALRRRESRGLHTTSDWTETEPAWVRDTFLQRRLSI
jgi:L-aspartate oxidase